MSNTSPLTRLSPDVLCLRCNNPSPLTGPGTNTFLVGQKEIAVIDPGPDDLDHLDHILAAVPDGARVTKVLVTHSHLDHSPNARALGDRVDAPVYAYGADGTGRSDVMRDLGERADLGGGEGRDHRFVPDITLVDGQTIEHDGQLLTALHTPGHYGNHMAFEWGRSAFTGDLVMAWATTLVSPPDGDVSDFLASCRKLADAGLETLYAAHGQAINDPNQRLAELISHRTTRETEVLAALRDAPATPSALTERIYAQVPKHLWPAAQRNVLAHLIDLMARDMVKCEGPFGPDEKFTLR